MRIDAHAHVYRSAPNGHPPFPADGYLRLLDEHGIAGGVLVQPSFLGTDNGELVAALRTAPDRLRGVAVCDETVTAEELRRLNAAGVRGLRLNFFRGCRVDMRTLSWQAVAVTLRQLGWHLELNSEDKEMAAVLQQVRGLGLPLTVDHLGRPDAHAGPLGAGFRALLRAAREGNVYLKLTGVFRLSSGAAKGCLAAWLEAVGADRILWGSDCPWVGMSNPPSYTNVVEWLKANVSPADRDDIIGRNAMALFGFSDDAPIS